MMLYDNIMKVIPLSGKDHRSVKLQNSFNIRLKHTEAHQITPMYGDLTQSDSALGVFYYQQKHVASLDQASMQLWFKKYHLHID